MAVDKDKNTQILVTFPNEMVEDIKEFWHDKKLRNRNEAIRMLISKGLEKHKQEGLEQED
jgi:metal-responsive CopG/Arc/MetJ family transcriptional regulator